MQEYHNIKVLLQKFALQLGLKKFLRLKKLKILYLNGNLNDEEHFGKFCEKELKITNQSDFRKSDKEKR